MEACGPCAAHALHARFLRHCPRENHIAHAVARVCNLRAVDRTRTDGRRRTVNGVVLVAGTGTLLGHGTRTLCVSSPLVARHSVGVSATDEQGRNCKKNRGGGGSGPLDPPVTALLINDNII